MFLILLQRYTFYLNRAIYRGIFLRKVFWEMGEGAYRIIFPRFCYHCYHLIL